MVALHLFAVLALVGVNAFFAAAEFSLVAVRQSRVRQLVEKGDARAKIVEGLLSDLSRVVSGELVPKSLSLARAERVALIIARPFHWFLNTFRWAIDLLDGFAEKIVGALGIVSPHSHTLVRSTEELQVMIQQAQDRGLLPAAEVKFIQAAMELHQVQVREVMVPRPDVHALPAEANVEDTMRMFATTQRSRIPVYEGSLDHLLGFVHIKDMIWVLLDRA